MFLPSPAFAEFKANIVLSKLSRESMIITLDRKSACF